MALRIYRSNRLDVLATVLGAMLRAPEPDPEALFTPQRVVVGTRGMERWLRHQLAVHNGVCAHVDFPFPRQLIEELLVGAEGGPALEPAPADPWAAGALAWRLLQVIEALPPAAQDDVWAPLRAYVGETTGPVDARRYALAVALGDLFDRYVTYRPALARAWSQGRPAPTADLPKPRNGVSLPTLPGALRWQPQLWRSLVQALGDAPHLAERLQRARGVFESGPVAGQAGPVRIFGLSTLPAEWLGLLASVARHHPVELYLHSPSDRWWGDLRARRGDARALRALDRDQVSEALLGDETGTGEGNPLLLSLGRVARDLQIVLESLDERYIDQDVSLFVEGRGSFVDPAGGSHPSALQRVQSDVLTLTHPASRPPLPLAPADDSIQLHACYGPTRQVEALRETLLGLFEAHPDLQPRDVVVMTPDIAAYAPLITAVFEQGAWGRRKRDGAPVLGAQGWGPAGAPRLPYEIADLSVRRLNPVADALLRVLELTTARATASAVLDLARLEPVRLRFGLEADDIETVGEIVRTAGARWGIDGQDRADHDQPADLQNTWIDALDRLWLGVAMPDTGGLYGDMVAEDGVEGGELDLLGRFGELVGVVLGAVRDLRDPRPVAAWVSRALTLVDDLTASQGRASWLTARAVEALEALDVEASGVSLDVSVQAFTAALAGRFDVAAGGLRPQNGPITFCALTPMRSLPYRVVCLLGMDEDAFPAKGSRAAFDLTSLAPRVGDRDRRDEDRMLLLEAILAAQDHLLVFYSGRDVHTDEALPPCVPVAELCDTLDGTFVVADGRAPTEALTVSHPLQPFSVATFRPPTSGEPWHRRPFSFDRRLAAGAGVAPLERPEPFWLREADPTNEPLVLSLAELIAFVDRPAKAFFRETLGVTFWDGVHAPEDREPVEAPEGLLKERLVAVALSSPDADSVSGRLDVALARLRGEGVLPLGAAGTWSAAPIRPMAAGLRAAATPWMAAPSQHCDIDLDLGGGLRLVGRIHDLREGDLFQVFPLADGSTRPWWSVATLLRLMAWQAASPGALRRAVLVYAGTSKAQYRTLASPLEDPVTAAADARSRLSVLADLLRLSRHGPPPLYGDTSWAFIKGLLHKDVVQPEHGWDAAAEWPPVDPTALAGVRTATDKALAAWFEGHNGGEVSTDYLRRLHPDGQPPWLDPETGLPSRAFAQGALALWWPAVKWRRVLRATPDPTGWGTP